MTKIFLKTKAWWKQDKRYITLMQSVLMALLPLMCSLVYCAMQGRTLGEVYLPESEWNDELFYFKQVEGMIGWGYPRGYFGFNESHALKLSFAAWSPVLVFPWILWGLAFGWTLMSPVACNIFLMSLAAFLFVWLVRPGWKQLGILTLLFCLYTPFVRYMLSVMPEVICFSLLILFYSLAVNYLNREKAWKLALLFVLSSVMTLMRPYMLLFMLLPAYFWIRKSRVRGALGALAVIGATLGIYAAVKHYLGAEYFAPLFFTDWVSAFFERGLFGGLRYTLSKLYYMGRDFLGHTMQGFRTGLASGAFFAGYLACMAVLLVQSFVDFGRWRRLRLQEKAEKQEIGKDQSEPGKPESGKDLKEPGKQETGKNLEEPEEREIGKDLKEPRKQEHGKDLAGRKRRDHQQASERSRLFNMLVIEVHLAFSFVAMTFALLLMYKLTEGSKHLLTFMAAAVFVIPLMETKYFKKAMLIGVTFAYFYSYMAVDPSDYQVPFVREERAAQVEAWSELLEDKMELREDGAPDYDNSVMWVFSDVTGGQTVNTRWQLLYALPGGFGISCCMPDYVLENFDSLQCRYICVVPGGEIEQNCISAGFVRLAEAEGAVLYQRY